MPVFKHKGIKVVTDADDPSLIVDRLPLAYQALMELRREVQGLPEGVYVRRNPGVGYKVTIMGAQEEIQISYTPPVPAPKLEVWRPELIPIYKYAPAFYAINEDGAFVGLVLARGAGWSAPYYFIPCSLSQLYTWEYGQWMAYSYWATMRGDYLWLESPSGEQWDDFRAHKPNRLPLIPSKKAIGDPPAMIYSWEIPARHEWILSTDYDSPEVDTNWSYTGCSEQLTYEPWDCMAGGFIALHDGLRIYDEQRTIRYQLRQTQYPDWPCGDTIFSKLRQVYSHETQLRYGHDYYGYCIPYPSPCNNADCYEPLVCGPFMASLSANYGAMCATLEGNRPTSWRTGSTYWWTSFHSYYRQGYTRQTTPFCPSVYGGTFIDAENGGALYYEREYDYSYYAQKTFTPIYDPCGRITNDRGGGSENAWNNGGIYSAGTEYIWVDGVLYPTGHQEYSNPENWDPYPVYPRYYKIRDGATLFLLSGRRTNYGYWEFYYVYPAGPLFSQHQFPIVTVQGQSCFEIPGMRYQDQQLYGTGKYTLVRYIEQALQRDIKEVF